MQLVTEHRATVDADDLVSDERLRQHGVSEGDAFLSVPEIRPKTPTLVHGCHSTGPDRFGVGDQVPVIIKRERLDHLQM